MQGALWSLAGLGRSSDGDSRKERPPRDGQSERLATKTWLRHPVQLKGCLQTPATAVTASPLGLGLAARSPRSGPGEALPAAQAALPAPSAPRTTAQFVRNLAEKAPALVDTAMTYLKPRLAILWHYAKVELVPPTSAEIPTAIQSLKKIVSGAQTSSFKQLTVKEALLNGLVATEVWTWFHAGEITGKRGIIGYDF
ncbi:ATP synthase subunit g, mitochondrial-like [Balaenoptera acutorostrata]|uniref:ATP synthase subunit g, mitochondrial-like n=1 Tax=Balaenoptera acutorostrata TaxID=9767 RepID=A0A383ZV97_BALAC|nr:ATP synthase subunit g, mitochondrial-like [Balaenoptera acutorostrata]